MEKFSKEYFVNLKERVMQIKNAGEMEKILEHKTMYERFKDVALSKPDAKAILYFGREYTFREFLTLIDNMAKGFSELGVTYDDVVTMSLLGTPYAIAAVYALDKIGATMHLVNAASNPSEVKRELSNFNSKFFVANDIFYSKDMQDALKEIGVEKVITTSLIDSIPRGFNACTMSKAKYGLIEKLKGCNKKLYDGENVFCFDEVIDLGRNSTKEVEEAKYNTDHIAAVAYTSGSTGNCKAVKASWDRLDAMVQIMGMTELNRFEPDDIMFSTFPTWLYYSLINMIHEPLSLGVALALDPLFSPKTIVNRNNFYRFNHWLTIPPYIQKMTEMNKKMDCSRWKIIVTGGAELKDSVKLGADEYIRRNGGTAEVVQGYGANELIGSFAYCYYNGASLGSMGKPCVGNILKVLDVETGKELGPNEPGVGYMYSAARMNGYHNDEEATNHNLVKDENGVVWYNSEDILHYNEQGEIFLDGRLRRMVLTFDAKGNPTKLIPERTKRSIATLDFVKNCEVITVPDAKVENTAIAYVVVKDGIVADEDLKRQIIDNCMVSIPEYMVPSDVVFIDEMPLNASKKPNLIELEKMYQNNNAVNNTKKKKRLFQK